METLLYYSDPLTWELESHVSIWLDPDLSLCIINIVPYPSQTCYRYVEGLNNEWVLEPHNGDEDQAIQYLVTRMDDFVKWSFSAPRHTERMRGITALKSFWKNYIMKKSNVAQIYLYNAKLSAEIGPGVSQVDTFYILGYGRSTMNWSPLYQILAGESEVDCQHKEFPKKQARRQAFDFLEQITSHAIVNVIKGVKSPVGLEKLRSLLRLLQEKQCIPRQSENLYTFLDG